MKLSPRLSLLGLFLLAALTTGATVASPADTLAALQAHDRAVHIHDQWIRDPYIVLANDGWYYLTGTTLKNEPDQVINIPAWRSRDLATWEKLPPLWSLADSSWLQAIKPPAPKAPSTGTGYQALGVGVPDMLVWAPEFHQINGRWVIVHTTNARVSNLLITAGPELARPLTEPMGADFGAHHDPSLFLDGDTPWLVWGVLTLRPLKPDFSGFAGPEITLAPADRKMGHEGSVIRKIGAKYVWFGTAWSTDTMRHGTYNLYYATSDKLTGPYGPRRFAGRFLGHGTPFQDKQGRWWCTAFYNANHPALTGDEAASRDLSGDAYTINRQGTTLVPLAVTVGVDGDVSVRALDPRYASPGAEEVQSFSHP